MMHHEAGPSCPLCETKLMTAHPYLASWFRRVKSKYINVHISWAWRGEADQNAFKSGGKSELGWPHSPHNHTTPLGKPYSLALDLFQEDEDGAARWSPAFFFKLNSENEADKEPLKWGGKWKSIGDSCHFQVDESLLA